MRLYIYFLFFLLWFTTTTQIVAQESLKNQIIDSLKSIVGDYCTVEKISNLSLTVNKKTSKITVNCAQGLSEMPFRPHNVKRIYNALDTILRASYPNHSITCLADKKPIEFFIPNYYRTEKKDSSRIFKNFIPSSPFVTQTNKIYKTPSGLEGKYLALWPSHGNYYDIAGHNWKWQRPVIFRTVEDLLSYSIVIPYLAPMLENAGAQIFIPRERDFQHNELIIDHDKSSQGSRFQTFNDRYQWTKALGGFAHLKPSYQFGENPFTMGSFDFIRSTTDSMETSRIEWVPNFQESGNYAVYISYHSFPNSVEDARYEIQFAGGKSEYLVNQTMGGGTWIYLGNYYFEAGKHKNQKIILSNLSTVADRVVTADALKIGGGMGNISRGPDSSRIEANGLTNEFSTSGKARYREGSRYWLQWAGMPDSIYSKTKNQNDYLDDFQSRGFWVNYLRNELNIPLDLAFALHTDAGTNKADTIIGTLGICTASSNQKSEVFPNGSSRWASRDLTDLIQSEIVNVIRKDFYPEWTRRGIWNKSYSESREPDVPTMLLELLSHQNYGDMQFAHDPRFRFTVARAIYKGMINYFESQDNKKYKLTPLSVTNFQANLSRNGILNLNWDAVEEDNEPRSKADRFIVYTSNDGKIFDQGRITNLNSAEFKLKAGQSYYFKVSALNDGGISFPSETLSAYYKGSHSPQILIVNGYDQISGPDSFRKDTLEGGFNTELDYGSPHISDLHILGNQIDYNKNSKYVNMEIPGHGETDRHFEDKLLPGNTFDYIQIHARNFKKLGYSYCSSTRSAFENKKIDPTNYDAVDLILGNQKKVIEGLESKMPEYKTFTLALQLVIKDYLEKGGNLILSGANIASDLGNSGNPEDQNFMRQVLKFKGHKSNNDSLTTSQWRKSNKAVIYSNKAEFGTGKDLTFYKYRPDELEIASNEASILARYENKKPAALFYDGNYKICSVGFPLESIKDEDESLEIFSTILKLIFKTN